MEWDHYEFKIASHYLSAMINGDFSGMTTEDCIEYRAFERQAYEKARASGFTVGHWAAEDGEGDDYGRCAITGLQAGRVTVKLMVYRKKTPDVCPSLCVHGKGFNCGICWPSAH